MYETDFIITGRAEPSQGETATLCSGKLNENRIIV